MVDKKQKVVSYRRAVWVIKNPKSIKLETCVVEAADKLKRVEERTIDRGNGQLLRLVSLRKRRNGEGQLLHITAETPGEAASVVPHAVRRLEIDVGTTQPPSDSEFMDGDAFVYVCENDVCMCATALHDTTIRYFLQAFFEKAKIRSDATQFDLVKVADVSKIMFVQKHGVQEIELRSTLFEATRSYQRRKAQPQSILGAVAKHVKAVLGSENDVNEDALSVLVTVRVDKRRKGLVLGEKRIKSLATDLLKGQEAEDDFAIITKTGERIGPNEIFVRTPVWIEGKGKSVERTKAWGELEKFYDNLASSGVLEQ